MTSSTSSKTPLILLLLLNPLINLPSTYAEKCEGDDPISCSNGGICKNGIKDYNFLLDVNDPGLITTSKRDMYCECPDEITKSTFGFSGIHCTTTYEKCKDGSVCFNKGFCERNYDANASGDDGVEVVETDDENVTYHCACPLTDATAEIWGLTPDVWAGKTCENKATDFCSDRDPFYELAGTKWFCTNGGKCIDGLDNLSNKCDCPEGFLGPHCEYDAIEYETCDLTCYNGGECKRGAKDMTTYTDSGMDIDHFLGGSNQNGMHCICQEGYTGIQCEMEEFNYCGSGICFNGGVCVERVGVYGETKDYHCECDEFNTKVAGEFCEHTNVEFCPAPEGHDPEMYYCANGGKCPLREPHDACTSCDEGWTGPRCETRVENEEAVKERNDCDLDCQNGGTCFFGDHPLEDDTLKTIPGLEFLQDNKHCRCPSGYIGLRCEMRYERCGAGEHYCLHGSGCVPDNDEFTCDCNEVSTSLVAYAGHYCEHTAAEFCQGPGAGKHSFCTEHGTCRGEIGFGQDHVGCDCEEGWTGDYCEFEFSQLRTDGIATKIFVGFVIVLILTVVIMSAVFCYRKRNSGRIAYEHPIQHHSNPYGDENDDDDDDDDDSYELKEVTII